MKKNSIFDSLKSPQFRYGGYATLMTVVVIAAVVMVSLVMDQVSWKMDLTRNRIYTLSPQTLQTLKGLETDVTITMISAVGQEDSAIKEILRRYALRSVRIKLQTVDPDRDPAWSRQYVQSGGFLRDGSIVVATTKRFKIIDPYDLTIATTGIDDPYVKAQATYLSAEKLLTAALLHATAERDIVVYALQGHGEANLGALGLADAAANDN